MAGLLGLSPDILYSKLQSKIATYAMDQIRQGLQHGGLAPQFFVDEICLGLMGFDITMRETESQNFQYGFWDRQLVDYFSRLPGKHNNRVVLAFVKQQAHHCVLATVTNRGKPSGMSISG